ncbi:MAG: thioredoxin family protein [Myxococcota bacterium]
MNERMRRRGIGGLLALAMAVAMGSSACGEGGSKPEPASKGSPKSAEPPASKADTPSSKAPEVAKPTPDDAKPGVQDNGEVVPAVDWFEGTLEEALAKAKADGKLVFVDVGAYWCPPCHRLDEEVFVRPEIGALLEQDFIAMHIDAEKGEGPEIVERYHVQAYPTMLVLEASGLEKDRMVDFLEPEAFATAIKAIQEGGNVLSELLEAVEANPDDLKKRYALGHAYVLAAKAEEADQQFEAVMLGDPKNELGLAARVLYDRALFVTYKLEGDPNGAIEQFKALQRRYPEDKLAVRAYRHIGRLLCKLDREEDAVVSLEAMWATDPGDPGLASSYGWFAFRQKCGAAQGLAAVQKGIEADPADADLRYVEAELLHLTKDDTKALDAIRKASELEPKTAFYRRQVRRFETLAGAAG